MNIARITGWLLFAAALAFGLYARFAALGAAPIAIDEYYLSRSIDGILTWGIPTWACGGYYQRGLLLQYVIAGLRELGTTPELGPRLVAAIGSVAVLPAIYLLGRRLFGVPAALIAVALVALSLWQVELARFGRFYAPFQAVFAWYLVYFLRVCIDDDRKAWRPLIGLTILGAFVWEGAIFLGAANFVPLLVGYARTGRVTLRDTGLAAGLGVLLVLIYLSIAAPVRYWSEIPPLPDGWTPPAVPSGSQYVMDLAQFSPRGILAHPLWLLLLAVPLAAFAGSLNAFRKSGQPPILLLGALVAALAAASGNIGAAVASLALLALLRPTGAPPLPTRAVLVFVAAIALCGVAWLGYVFSTNDWTALVAEAGSPARAAAALVNPLVHFPDLVAEIVRPFAVTVPRLGALIALALAVLWLAEVRKPDAARRPRGALLLLVLLLLLAVGASGPPRHETRYVAFLYPALMLLVVAAGVQVAKWIRPTAPAAGIVGALAVALAFAATEDWNPRHLARIATPEGLFRAGMNEHMQAHLGEARDDIHAIARWLDANVDPARDRAVNGVHGVDYYYRGFSHLHVPEESSNYRDWACLRGTVDRWTNLPLLTSPEALAAEADGARYVYLVTWSFEVPALSDALRRLSPEVVEQRGSTVILRLGSP